VVVRELDELRDVIIPLLAQLDNLVDVLVASVLILPGRESTADRLRLGHLIRLLHRQVAHASLESEGLEETTALYKLAALNRSRGSGVGVGLRLRIDGRGLRVVRVVMVVMVVVVVASGIPGVQLLVKFTAGKGRALGRRSSGHSTTDGGWGQWHRSYVHWRGDSATGSGMAATVLLVRSSGTVSRRNLVVRLAAGLMAVTVAVAVRVLMRVLVVVRCSTARTANGCLGEHRGGRDDSGGAVSSNGSGSGSNRAAGGRGNWCVGSTFNKINPRSSSREGRD
jgi:hypothetical protein